MDPTVECNALFSDLLRRWYGSASMHFMNKTEQNRLAELEERIVELEIRFTHQARQLEELNEVLTESADFITVLRQENMAFRQMLKGLSPEMLESPDE